MWIYVGKWWKGQKFNRWAVIPLETLNDFLLILKSVMLTPLILWNWGLTRAPTGKYLPPGNLGPLVYGGTNEPFGYANRKFDFRWNGFTYHCPWCEARLYGVCYAVRYEMNRMRQVRKFIANGGEPGIHLSVEEVQKANGL